ncbi:MAG: hypothetical protein ACODAB_04715 [Gemmatimonadota bacterium]
MTLDGWLEPRLAEAPTDLADAIRQLVRGLDESDADIPGRLAAAALRGFEDVLTETAADLRSRRAALRLLAADASLTYAFEAAADLDIDVVDLAEGIGPRGSLGAMLDAATAEEAS